MRRIILIPFISLALFNSCRNPDNDFDTTIHKFYRTDFSVFKGFSIHYRSRGHEANSSIYFVNTENDSCSPYAVELQNIDSAVKINNDLVLKSCGRDYLTKERIELVIKNFLKLDIYLLQVDHEGNVYINANSEGESTLLRKKPNSRPKNLHLFKKYKGDWYVRK